MPKIAASVASEAIRAVAGKIRLRKVPGSLLKTISGFQNLDDSCLERKEVRQAEPAQVDEIGKDISDKWVLSDSVSACTGDSAVLAIQWVKKHINFINHLQRASRISTVDIHL